MNWVCLECRFESTIWYVAVPESCRPPDSWTQRVMEAAPKGTPHIFSDIDPVQVQMIARFGSEEEARRWVEPTWMPQGVAAPKSKIVEEVCRKKGIPIKKIQKKLAL